MDILITYMLIAGILNLLVFIWLGFRWYKSNKLLDLTQELAELNNSIHNLKRFPTKSNSLFKGLDVLEERKNLLKVKINKYK